MYKRKFKDTDIHYRLAYAWLFFGIVFIVLGVLGLISSNWFGLLNIGIGSLITYTSLLTIGGWRQVWWTIRSFLPQSKPKEKAPKRQKFEPGHRADVVEFKRKDV
jgi:hypothetical protein